MKSRRTRIVVVVCLALLVGLYGGTYAVSRRVALSGSGRLVIMDYAWATGENRVAESLFALHRPLIAID